MDEKTEQLLLSIAGFLNLITNGMVPVPAHAKTEATELLEKIGEAIAAGRDA